MNSSNVSYCSCGKWWGPIGRVCVRERVCLSVCLSLACSPLPQSLELLIIRPRWAEEGCNYGAQLLCQSLSLHHELMSLIGSSGVNNAHTHTHSQIHTSSRGRERKETVSNVWLSVSGFLKKKNVSSPALCNKRWWKCVLWKCTYNNLCSWMSVPTINRQIHFAVIYRQWKMSTHIMNPISWNAIWYLDGIKANLSETNCNDI